MEPWVLCEVTFAQPPGAFTQAERDEIADRLATLARFVKDPASPEAAIRAHLYGLDDRGRPHRYLVETLE